MEHNNVPVVYAYICMYKGRNYYSSQALIESINHTGISSVPVALWCNITSPAGTVCVISFSYSHCFLYSLSAIEYRPKYHIKAVFLLLSSPLFRCSTLKTDKNLPKQPGVGGAVVLTSSVCWPNVVRFM